MWKADQSQSSDYGRRLWDRAVAIAFAREGADVAISYLPSEETDAQEVIALIEQAGRRAIALPGDITDEQFCRKLVTDAVAALGGLDILVNNAGKQKSQPSLGDITSEQFDQVLKTNVYALFWITQEAVTHLKPGAAIINTTSIQGYDPSESLIDYAMTKAAIVSFSKSVSKQMIEKGVRVNAVAPGPFWTPLQPSGGQTQDKIEKFGSEVPMGRPGQPIEIAPVQSLLSMYCLRLKKEAISPERCMVSRAGLGSRKALYLINKEGI